MKSIYIITLSEDGIFNAVFTNKKALYNGILETEYKVQTVGTFEKKYKIQLQQFG